MIDIDQHFLTVPSGDPNKDPQKYDIEKMWKLEARRPEISTVTKVNAPELMQAFTDGYGITSRICAKLEGELEQAESAMEARKATVYLDEAPKILKQKGVVRDSNPSGSEEQRKAVLALDKEYKNLKDRYDQIKAAKALMNTYSKTFEMAFQSVKKIYDT